MTVRPRPGWVATVALALAAGCASGAAPAAPPPSSPPTTAATSAAGSPTLSPCPAGVDVRRWPLARRVAQLVTVPSLGTDLAALAPVVRAGVGGVLLLGNAVPADLPRQLAAVDRLTPDHVPLLVMADEEGGGVQRLRGLVGDLPWPRDMAATMTPAQVRARVATVGRQMRALGVTVDLAPVVDVDARPGPDAQNPDGQRSFSGDPAAVTRYAVAFIDGLRDAGVVAVAKHFPGLGGSTGNTDVGPGTTLSLANLRAGGLAPFRAAITAGVPAVMVSNATVPGLTASPASVAPVAVTGLLRTTLGFRGLVVTDSLSAGALSVAGYDVPAAAAQAVRAGADLVLFGSTRDAAELARLQPTAVAATVDGIVAAVTALVRSGVLPVAQLDAAVLRVLAVKGLRGCG